MEMAMGASLLQFKNYISHYVSAVHGNSLH